MSNAAPKTAAIEAYFKNYPDVHREVIVKEDARRLLETDMPSRNPQLVEQMAVKFGSPA